MGNYTYGIISNFPATDGSGRGNYTLGMQFYVKEAVVASGIRIYAYTLSDSYTATIWDSSRTRLASVTVTKVPGQWAEYMLETPITLEPNENYVVSIYCNNKNYEYWRMTPQTSENFVYVKAVETGGDSYPTGDSSCWGLDIIMGEPKLDPKYYNGTELLEPPTDAKDYPYHWVRENLATGHYEMILSNKQPYLDSNANKIVYDSATVEDIVCYRLATADVGIAENWTEHETNAVEFELDSDKTVLWTNHNILIDSVESEDVYFYKTCLVPHNAEEEYSTLYYNGTELPKLPMEVIGEHPFCWISPAKRLVISSQPWYYTVGYMLSANNAESVQYKLSENKTEWVLETSYAGDGRYHIYNLPMWANYDMLSDSVTSTDIYFVGTEPTLSKSGGVIVPDDDTSYEHTVDFSEDVWSTTRPDIFTITNGNVPFYVDSTFTYENKPTFRSGNIGHSSDSETTINFELVVDGSIAFNYTISSESPDYLYVYIDGTQVIRTSGTVNWTDYTKALSAGRHTIKFQYHKDGSVNTGKDACAIGYITFNGVPPAFVKTYLVRCDNVLYTVVDNVLTSIDAKSISSTAFLDCGCYDCPTWEHLSHLINPEVLCWFDSNEWSPTLTANMTATPFSQIIISNKIDLTHKTITGIEKATVICEGNPLFCVSFDNKQTWKAWNGVEWSTVSEEYSGMTRELFESIDYDIWLPMYQSTDSFYIKAILNENELSQSITQIYVDFAN